MLFIYYFKVSPWINVDKFKSTLTIIVCLFACFFCYFKYSLGFVYRFVCKYVTNRGAGKFFYVKEKV